MIGESVDVAKSITMMKVTQVVEAKILRIASTRRTDTTDDQKNTLIDPALTINNMPDTRLLVTIITRITSSSNTTTNFAAPILRPTTNGIQNTWR